MEKHWVEEIFEDCGAMLNGHFVLASGRHSGRYLDKMKIFEHKDVISEICYEIAKELFSRFNDYTGNGIEVVVGPERGGKILARGVARHLRDFYPIGRGRVLARFTKKDKEGNQVLEEKYIKDIKNKKVLIIDDVLTTGRSIRKVIEEVKKAGGRIVGVVVLCNRGGVTPKDIGGYTLVSLWETKIESWPEEECPLCKKGIPIIKTK